jgi:hypothetical protein
MNEDWVLTIKDVAVILDGSGWGAAGVQDPRPVANSSR